MAAGDESQMRSLVPGRGTSTSNQVSWKDSGLLGSSHCQYSTKEKTEGLSGDTVEAPWAGCLHFLTMKYFFVLFVF